MSARKLTKLEFIERAVKVHGDKYDYSNVVYNGYRERINIVCPRHGEFYQRASTHLRGNGCLSCSLDKSGRTSIEKKVEKYLTYNGIKYIEQYSPIWLKRMRLDFYLPNYNIAIECQGRQHFQSLNYYGGDKGFEYRLVYDIEKYKLCKENGLELIYYIPKEFKEINVCEIYTKENVFRYVDSIIEWLNSIEYIQKVKKHNFNTNNVVKVIEKLPHKRKLLYTDNDIIKKFISVHGDKYDYSNVVYNGFKKHTTIICRKHGIFNQRVDKHLNGQGCPKCSSLNGNKIKKLSFHHLFYFDRCRFLYRNFYSYHKNEKQIYHIKDNIIVTCPIHGDFNVSIYEHLNRYVYCTECNNVSLSSIKDLKDYTDSLYESYKLDNVSKIHGNRYKYLSCIGDKLTIECSKHGRLIISYKDCLYKKSGCPKCGLNKLSKNNSYTTKKFIEKSNLIHRDKYDYSKVEYINSHIKVCIICTTHGEFYQLPYLHIQGHGCSKCSKYKSKNNLL